MERKNEGDVGFNHARKTHIIRERLSMNREGDTNRSRGFSSEFARACIWGTRKAQMLVTHEGDGIAQSTTTT